MSSCGHNGVNITSAGPAELVSSRVTPPPQLHFSSAQLRIHPRDAQRTQPCVYGETISADSLRHVVPAAQRARSVVYVSHHPTPHHPLTQLPGTSKTFLKFAFAFHITTTYIGSLGPTSGISMVPTIPSSFTSRPWILYSSLHRRGRNIRVGDVITYTHPLFPHQKGCKRVIGMPGDFVSVVSPAREDGDVEKDADEGGLGKR